MEKPISSDFPFESKFLEIKGSKIHYIDEGMGDPVLFLHGNPTSSYLWRNIIPYMTDKSRCIAPDLIGMGKSDKPDINYGFNDSYEYLRLFIEKLGLKNITLVIHDWGSGLGFHYAHQHPRNIKGIAFMEAVYKLVDFDKQIPRVKTAMTLMRSAIGNWLMIGVANLFIKGFLPNGIVRKLIKEEMDIYKKPYPNLKSRKPIRVWPQEIAINGHPKHTHKIVSEYHEWLKKTEIPKICFYADPGMLIPKGEIPWIKENLPNITMVDIGNGLHFVQEDNPHKIGEELARWFEKI